MKKRTLLIILSAILLSLGALILFGLIILVLLGWFVCGKPSYIPYGANGPIPTCKIITNTDYIKPLIPSILLLTTGTILLITQIKKKVKR